MFWVCVRPPSFACVCCSLSSSSVASVETKKVPFSLLFSSLLSFLTHTFSTLNLPQVAHSHIHSTLTLTFTFTHTLKLRQKGTFILLHSNQTIPWSTRQRLAQLHRRKTRLCTSPVCTPHGLSYICYSSTINPFYRPCFSKRSSTIPFLRLCPLPQPLPLSLQYPRPCLPRCPPILCCHTFRPHHGQSARQSPLIRFDAQGQNCRGI